MKKLISFTALFGLLTLANGQTTFNLAFGVLTNADGTTPAANGSLVQFISAPTVGDFTQPTPTTFINGLETLLWSGALDSTTNGDIAGSMFTAVTVSVPQGYALKLQWFPTLGIAASAPGYSTPYGQYSLVNDVTWVAPASGSTVSMNFLTDTPFGTGTSNALGIANLATTAIPEPSTYAAIFGALALGFVAYRRRQQAA